MDIIVTRTMSSTALTMGFVHQSPSPFYKAGWLTKQGHLVKNWKRRWFMLSKAHIAYAEDHSMKSIKGTIDLDEGASVTTKVPRELLDVKYPFLFVLKPGKADSLEDMLSWTAAFHRCIVQLPVWRSEQVHAPPPPTTKAPIIRVADTLALADRGSSAGSSTSSHRQVSALSDSPALFLPDALLQRIMSYLPEADLCRVCFVCTRWRTIAEEDSLWQGLVSRTYRFYRANAKQQRWKNFYRDTPQMLPRPSSAGLAKATKHSLRSEPLSSTFSGSDTGNRRGVFLLQRASPIPARQTAFACVIRSPEHQAFLLAQSYILTINSHPNLVRPVDCFIEKTLFWAACEGEMHVSLASLVESAGGALPEEIIGAVCCDLLRAVSFLHTLGYICGAVRSENVACYLPNQVKLGAYAVTHCMLPLNERLGDYVSLTHWTPPEVFTKKNVSKAGDVWQVGVTAIEMALLEPPYGQYAPERSLALLLEKGIQPLLAKSWSAEFKEWLSLCLAIDPAQRATYTSLLMHNFIAGKAASPAKMQAFLTQERRDFFSNLLS